MNKLALFAASSLALLASTFVACAPSTPDQPEDEDIADEEDALRRTCGGFAGIACPDGKVCVDDPHDSCDPANGGADCGGVCRGAHPDKKRCKDPNRTYISNDPNECAYVRFYCAEGTPFFDDCGCGCEDVASTPCGANSCGDGEYCCNESCGICAPIGGFCIEQYCGPTCSPQDCGPQLGMPNYACDDGVTVAGPTGNCLPTADGSGCGWEVIGCP